MAKKKKKFNEVTPFDSVQKCTENRMKHATKKQVRRLIARCKKI